jgi:hypothetical protein
MITSFPSTFNCKPISFLISNYLFSSSFPSSLLCFINCSCKKHTLEKERERAGERKRKRRELKQKKMFKYYFFPRAACLYDILCALLLLRRHRQTLSRDLFMTSFGGNFSRCLLPSLCRCVGAVK